VQNFWQVKVNLEHFDERSLGYAGDLRQAYSNLAGFKMLNPGRKGVVKHVAPFD